jgi:enoyl reductase-like protein
VHRSLEKHRWIDVTYESRCFTMLCRFEQRFHRAGPLVASDVSKLDTEPMAYIVRKLFILVRPRLHKNNDHFVNQDRLGTSTGKALTKRENFFLQNEFVSKYPVMEATLLSNEDVDFCIEVRERPFL